MCGNNQTCVENPHRRVFGFFHTCLVKHTHKGLFPPGLTVEGRKSGSAIYNQPIICWNWTPLHSFSSVLRWCGCWLSCCSLHLCLEPSEISSPIDRFRIWVWRMTLINCTCTNKSNHLTGGACDSKVIGQVCNKILLFLGRRPLNLDQALWTLSFKSTLAAKKRAR